MARQVPELLVPISAPSEGHLGSDEPRLREPSTSCCHADDSIAVAAAALRGSRVRALVACDRRVGQADGQEAEQRRLVLIRARFRSWQLAARVNGDCSLPDQLEQRNERVQHCGRANRRSAAQIGGSSRAISARIRVYC